MVLYEYSSTLGLGTGHSTALTLTKIGDKSEATEPVLRRRYQVYGYSTVVLILRPYCTFAATRSSYIFLQVVQTSETTSVRLSFPPIFYFYHQDEQDGRQESTLGAC